MLKKLNIRNKEGELLEAISEGAPIETADKIVVMVHGFGTSLHERGLFDDISKEATTKFPTMAVVRFSWPGFGKSEGKQEETTLLKVADCAKTVLDYVYLHKKDEAEVVTLSHSMGNRALSKCLAENHFDIKLFIAECPSEFKTKEEFYDKWASRPGNIFEKDILITPRADGTTTRIGKGFWDSIDPIEYRANLTEIAEKSNSVLIRALEDSVVNNVELTTLPFKNILELHGNHSFSKPENRTVFLEKLIEILGE